MFSLLQIVFLLLAWRTQADPTPRLGSEPEGRYSWQYNVDAPEYGTWFGQWEQRRGDTTRGQWRVHLPDQRLQTVTYTAGVNGYQAQVSYEDKTELNDLRSRYPSVVEAPSHHWTDGKDHHHDQHTDSNEISDDTRRTGSRRPSRPIDRKNRPKIPINRVTSNTPSQHGPSPPSSGNVRPQFPPRPPSTKKPFQRRPQRPSSFTESKRPTLAQKPNQFTRNQPSATRRPLTQPRPQNRPATLQKQRPQRPLSRPPNTRPNHSRESSETETEEEIIQRILASLNFNRVNKNDPPTGAVEKPHYEIRDRGSVVSRLAAVVHGHDTRG